MNLRSIEFYSRLTYHSLMEKNSIFVLSYPRSGSSWLCRMLSSATELPYGKNSPFLTPQIIHLHRFFLTRELKSRAVYIVRDVRDVILSYSNALIDDIDHGRINEDYLINKYGVSRRALDPDDKCYIDFVRKLMSSTYISVDWVSSVNRAMSNDLVMIRYEDLRAEADQSISKVLNLLGKQYKSEGVGALHLLEKERKNSSIAFNVRKGEAGGYRHYEHNQWVEETTCWAATQLQTLGYDC